LRELAGLNGMYEVREARREDFEHIAEFPKDRREAFFMYPKGSYPFSADQLYEVSLTRAIPTVILREDEVVGYANVYDWTEGESCWIGNVVVNPRHRGQGAGKFLIETMIKKAKEELKVKEINLVCHNVNTRALLLYHKIGFKPFGIKPIIDHENRDIAGILMRYSLS
jgi:RimJ/RimL family protein N-acetyltransferase